MKSKPLSSGLKENLKSSYQKMKASSKLKENEEGSRHDMKNKVYRVCAICGESLKTK